MNEHLYQFSEGFINALDDDGLTVGMNALIVDPGFCCEAVKLYVSVDADWATVARVGLRLS